MSLLLGYDIGSSSIKAALLDSETGRVLASAASPDREMAIDSPRPGWAEQPPLLWWENVRKATAAIRSAFGPAMDGVAAIGISYQMHGLVLVDENQEPLRPAIIWCDSRCVAIGEEARRRIGSRRCIDHLLNFPGNFTASKLKWVIDNEPELYGRVHKAMLPGDFIAMRMTGEIVTTPSGLSEGTLWDFRSGGPARIILDDLGIADEKLPRLLPTFSVQGELTTGAAADLGLPAGTAVTYRAGDQPNNAFSLNVLDPGEVAATAGTSGVVYGVSGIPVCDGKSRVNTFVHVNHTDQAERYGVLLCINGTGILNSWTRRIFTENGDTSLSYEAINELATRAPAGSEGLLVLPFGNGAERTLDNRDLGASFHGLDFNRHGRAHLFRAVQEGIVFALNHGLQIMKEMGVAVHTVRAGHANLFLSPLFRKTFAALTGARVTLFNTDGAQGAARGAGIGAGVFRNRSDAFHGLEAIEDVEPETDLAAACREAYDRWSEILRRQLKN
jgi:xylulokinase